MKKILSILLLGSALLASSCLEARGGHRGGRRGGHMRGRHGGHGRRHGGWGRRGWGPGFGFGISVGGPRYYEPAPVVYVGDPYAEYIRLFPSGDEYGYKRWLRVNRLRFRNPYRSYYGRWRAPRVGVGFGFGF